MKLVYIAGPYRGQNEYVVERNRRRAEAMMMNIAAAGHAPLCPHTMTRYCDGTITDEYWLSATMEMLRRCDAMVCCEGWEDSDGTAAEIEEAYRLGIPVYRCYGEFIMATSEVQP